MTILPPEKKKMGQPLKFGTPEKRKAMWKALIEHVSGGLSFTTFPMCDHLTCLTYAERFPEDCPIEELDEAKRLCLAWWEKLGRDGAMGAIEGFNATSWIFNMKNRAGWADKVDQGFVGRDGQKIDPPQPILLENYLTKEQLEKIMADAQSKS